MIPVMAAIAAVQAIEQAQQAKKQQDIENSKIAYSSWTGMQPKAVQTSNNAFIEGAGGYIKDMEYADAQKDADMQRKYLAKRTAWLDMHPEDRKAAALGDA